jgi:4-amino-4-deoxy-L-arabinose transferase-like glycosyltransferase
VLVSEGRPRRYAAAGALAGLAFLVRPDSVLLAAPFAVALGFVAGWRPRLRAGLCALAAVLIVVGPWALRNVAHFGAPHLFVVGLDRSSRPHGGGAFRAWMSTWAVDTTELSTYEYCFNRDAGCLLTEAAYPPQAFASPRQQERVGELLRLHAMRTDEERVERGFAALAVERRRQRPLTTRLLLPLRRALLLWTRPDLIVDKPDQRPWPAVYARLAPWLRPLCVAFALAFAASLVALLWQRPTRAWAAILGSAVLFRTAILAYYYFPEPRYLCETVPAAGLVIVLALATLGGRLGRRPLRA